MALLATLILQGCAPGGGSTVSPGTEGSLTCPAAATMAGALVSRSDASPFAPGRKVVLSGVNDAQGMSGVNIQKNSAPVVMPAGTDVTVMVKDQCSAGGEISSSVLAGRESANATPGAERAYTWKLPRDLGIDELESLAENDACVVGLADSRMAAPSGAFDDPLVKSQGHLAMMETQESYSLIFAQQSLDPVVIAIVDTGVDASHPDLKDVLWRNPGEIPGNRVDDDRNGYVDDVIGYNFGSDTSNPQYSASWGGSEHGTHVAGLAAAQGGNGVGGSGVIGSGAKLMNLNVFGSHSGASSSDIVNAIRYAVDNGADVINMSLGGTGRTAAYESAIGYAISKGVMVFAAAGNERREVGPGFFLAPAAYAPQFKGLVSVGSVDSTTSALSTFSNYSPTYVKVGAPGSEKSSDRVGLLSTWPGGGHQRIQGTSMSTPVASGVAALAISMMRARGYAPSPATIEGILAAGSPSVPALSAKIHNGRVLNVKRIAEFIQGSYPVRGGSDAPIDPGAPDDGACI